MISGQFDQPEHILAVNVIVATGGESDLGFRQAGLTAQVKLSANLPINVAASEPTIEYSPGIVPTEKSNFSLVIYSHDWTATRFEAEIQWAKFQTGPLPARFTSRQRTTAVVNSCVSQL